MFLFFRQEIEMSEVMDSLSLGDKAERTATTEGDEEESLVSRVRDMEIS